MAKQQRPALGRGLDALISKDDLKTGGSSSINEVELSKITPNPDQPRTIFDEEALEELAASIKKMGLVQPITLRQIDTDAYQIIAGERRYRASLKAGLTKVPAYIKTTKDDNMMEMAIVENTHREDLNPIELALAFQSLIETRGWTQEKLSEEISKNRATIANFLRLLRLPAEIQMGLKDKKINMGHAKLLLSMEDPSDQLMVYEQIVEYGFSVRKTEEIIHELNRSDEQEPDPAGTQTPTTRKKPQEPDEYQLLKKHLSDFFHSKVTFNVNEKGAGKITIPFASPEDLERIVQLFDEIRK